MADRNIKKVSLDNRGLTLIELIITMAVSGIVVLIIIGFIDAGIKAYTKANGEVGMQMEAQTVLNQLEDLLLEASYIETVTIAYNKKACIIYNADSADMIIHDSGEEKLYYMDKVPFDQLEDLTGITYNDKENLMGIHVKSFHITREELKKQKNRLTLELSFTLDNRINQYNKQIVLRNQMKKPE